MDNIIYTFSEGRDSCEHNFIYSGLEGMNFTYPPQMFRERICPNCGRCEKVILHDDLVINIDADLFKRIKFEFGLKE
jgi:hypothetical protein